MIFFSYYINEEAKADYKDTVSKKTGKEFTYTYYIELVQKFRMRNMPNEEYYDFEVCQYKYDPSRQRI